MTICGAVRVVLLKPSRITKFGLVRGMRRESKRYRKPHFRGRAPRDPHPESPTPQMVPERWTLDSSVERLNV